MHMSQGPKVCSRYQKLDLAKLKKLTSVNENRQKNNEYGPKVTKSGGNGRIWPEIQFTPQAVSQLKMNVS